MKGSWVTRHFFGGFIFATHTPLQLLELSGRNSHAGIIGPAAFGTSYFALRPKP
jgi:hypothetical protein